MNEQLKQRLTELRNEYAAGEEKLQALNTETVQLRDTMLRISGAIQVLEEELSKALNDTGKEERLKAVGSQTR